MAKPRFHRKVKAAGVGAGGGVALATGIAAALGVTGGPWLAVIEVAVAVLGAVAAGYQTKAAPGDTPAAAAGTAPPPPNVGRLG